MNSAKYMIVLLSFLSLMSCEKTFFRPEPENNPEGIFEELWNTFDRDYAVFDERGINWQEQYDLYRPRVDANTTDEELAEVFKQMLRSLNDGHVSLTIPNERVYYSNIIIDQEIDIDLFDLDLVKSKYMQNASLEKGNGGITYGWIGSVGYLHLPYIGANMFDIGEVLDYFRDGNGLIVDLRHNGGGDFTYALSEFGRFTDEKRLAFRSKTKNGPGKNDFPEWFDWYVNPAGAYFDKPIVVLTDRYTISAGERILLAFKTLPNIIQMGDTSSGALSTKVAKELPNGWYYTVVTQKIASSDGQYFEGLGIPPDIFVYNTAEEMAAGVDHQLETALGQF
ncbi:MAG: S41 family peptidase [Lewinellaceae bacterium]|nr:S41 family peptidase [Lewinellaceae bacterium]